jgi:hypothetical protein
MLSIIRLLKNADEFERYLVKLFTTINYWLSLQLKLFSTMFTSTLKQLSKLSHQANTFKKLVNTRQTPFLFNNLGTC